MFQEIIYMHSKDDKTTLLILSPGFAANESDTSCLPAQQSLIRSINKAFPEIRVMILAFEYPYTRQPYTWFENEVIPFNGRTTGGTARLLRWIKIWMHLLKLKRKYRVTGILSFWLGQSALVGSYFAKCHRLKHFTWILGQDARKANPYIKWIRPDPDSLIAMSDFLAKQLFTHYAVKPACIIPNGIDTDLFPPFAGKKDIDIIGVGSLIPLKQYDLFIEVVRDIKKNVPALKVYLCGEGAERNRLTRLIQQYGLVDTITLTGEKTHAEVLQLMLRSKLLLHPSAYEGFSGACLEALYAGAHVISFQQPMNGWIRHWHIAETKEEMIQIAKMILGSVNISFEQVLPYRMKDTAEEIIRLFPA